MILEFIMQTVAVQIQDSFMQNFLSFINNHQENITITKDKNLELDPYFYERQKELQQDIDDIDSGKIQMISQEKYNMQINDFFQKLKNEN